MRNALGYAGKTQRRIVSAWIGTGFAQDADAAARKQWRDVGDQARPRVPRLAALRDDAEADVLTYMGFPAQPRAGSRRRLNFAALLDEAEADIPTRRSSVQHPDSNRSVVL